MSGSQPGPADLTSRLPLRPVPLVPEIVLHGAGPASRLAEFSADGQPPYWAFPWPGGQLLARYLLDNPELVRGRRVADIGSGSGLVAIAAMKAGATAALAIDVDPNAALIAPANAIVNGVRLDVQIGDALAVDPLAGIDMVLVGDLFYEPRLAARAIAWLDRCAISGQGILVGDIGRPALPTHRLLKLTSMEVSDFGGGPACQGSVCRWMAPG